MIKSINLVETGHSVTEDNTFIEMIGKRGASQQFSDIDNSYIMFVIRGALKIIDRNGVITTTMPDHMYAFSITDAPYYAEAIDDYHCLVLLSSSLRHHLNADNVKKVLGSNVNRTGLGVLKYGDVMRMFVENLIMLKNHGVLAGDITVIKKVEFLHYLRQLYSIDELVEFAHGIITTYSQFKIDVFRAYRNSITVQDLANALFMTTKTLSRRFKDEFKATPQDWIIEQKLYNLNHLIVNRGYTISQIIEEFDFSSESAFKQFCKRHNRDYLVDMASLAVI